MIKVSISQQDSTKAKEAIQKANKAKEIPTMEESWAKIWSMKNSDSDLKKLKLVKTLMDSGKIGREEDKLSKAFTKTEAMRLFNRYQESMRAQRLEEMANEDLEKFPLINTEESLKAFVDGAMKADGVPSMGIERLVSMDTETVGDDGGVDKYSERISGWSMTYYVDGKEFNGYVPLRHRKEVSEGIWERDERNIDIEVGEEAIKTIFASGVDTVWHNATFDLGLIWTQLGVEPVGNIHDTLIIMHLLDEDLMSYALKRLATTYLDIPSETFQEMFGKNARFANVPLPIARWYASKDTWIGYKLFQWQVDTLNKDGWEKIKKAYLHIEMPCIRTTFHMERVGFIMDLDELEKQRYEAVNTIKDLEEKLGNIPEFDGVNFNSPKQLSDAIYDRMKLGKHLSKKQAQQRSTKSEYLKILSEYDPRIKLLLDYRDMVKHLTGFVEGVKEKISPDGRLHGDFNQSATTTLRYTSNNPNLQQIPKKARKLFRVPESQVIIGADFSQQEPRLATHMSRCKDLISLYEEGRDLYSETASSIFNKPLEECGDGSIYRKQTKVVVLAVLYGMGSFTLAQSLKITPDEAQERIDGFYRTYPEMELWIKSNEATVKRQRYVETLWGTRRRFKGINFNRTFGSWNNLTEEDKAERSAINRALRQATNALVQGGAAMQTKQTMVALEKRLEELNEARDTDDFQLLAQIHDEVLLTAPKDVTRDEVESIRDAMVNTVKLIIPSKTDIELGNCWGAMVGDKEWFDNEEVEF